MSLPNPDGYAVVMDDGAYVGIWREREIAEKIVNRCKHSQKERIVEMFAATVVCKLVKEAS